MRNPSGRWDACGGGLVERGGGGCVCAAAVTVLSHSTSRVGLGLERRLAVWNLSYLTTTSLSVAFLSWSFLTLNFSRASCSPGPLLPDLCDVASLLLNAGLWRFLNEQIKNGEAGLKQLLKMGMPQVFFSSGWKEKIIINDCFGECE